MVRNEELDRIQGFVRKQHKDAEAIQEYIEKYKEGLETSRRAEHQFLMERQKWVIAHIGDFIKDLQSKFGNIVVKHITFYNDPERIMRVKFLQQRLTIRDYYASNGWCAPREDSELQQVQEQ